jgi:magnesium-transporting ATPase (P-type)
MAHAHVPSEILTRYLPRSTRANTLASSLFAIGLVSFVIRLAQDPHSAWISYVSNWLFFTSISIGAVLLAVATWITKAKWNWSVRRVSQAMVAFLPISFVLLLPMLTLREGYFPWIEMMGTDPIVQKKAAYLNIPFLVSRNVVGLAVLFGMALYFVYLAVRPDLGLSDKSELDDGRRRGWRKRLTQGWAGQEQEEVASHRRMTTLAPAFVMAYAVVMTVVAYDWVMSLEPHWYSTMLGPWFFMGAFWGGIAATILWGMYLRTKHKDVEHCVGLQVRHDLGKLAFAFTVFWTYLFFSQYLVIWYGKLPWEQAWIIRRSEPPWSGFSALVVVLCFVVPFAGLIGRKAKMKPSLLAAFATVILVGLWLERYGMVAPSLHREGEAVFTIWHPLIGAMFLGLWIGSIRWFLTTFPAVQIWQPMSDPESLEAERTPEGAARG